MNTFDRAATVQAASYLIKKSGGKHDMYCLIKMLYRADREMLKRWGMSITGARAVSMRHGPVLSEVYDQAKGQRFDPMWTAHIEKVGYDLVLKQQADTDELSQAALAILDETYSELGGMGFSQMRNWAHSQPECVETDRSCTLSRTNMLKPHGVTEESIQQMEEDAELFNSFQAYFGV